ncbi:GGDEF domain-containing protein [Candidatus Galacturonibacter soehngenii]|uniref:GGDEF domain-containing protein n=1 Tax=Candidatus Galacturonatibacter soehngenii TaxID=2307010 RepID=A0A7V7QMD1_9FIRM|nr:GGDEF domain-containing protein [Candidatus Galacturonibacter soehngenii]KAB1439560.1 GGDEF domain-containing protein [Candidatus Galacturonibacter soehngenii]
MMKLNCKKNSYDLIELLFLLCILVGIIILCVVSRKDSYVDSSKSFSINRYSGWTLDNKKESVFYHTLPSDLNMQAILFRTPFQNVEVFVGSQLIYCSNYESRTRFNQNYGYYYHIVNLMPDYESKKITIHLKGEYVNANERNLFAYIGQPQQLLYYIVTQNIFELVMGSSLFVIGVLLLLISILFIKKIQTKMSFHVGICALLFSTGLLLSTDILQLIYNKSIVFVSLQDGISVLLPISVLLNFRELFFLQKDRGLKILIRICSVSFISRIMIQLLQANVALFPFERLLFIMGVIYSFVLIAIKKRVIAHKNRMIFAKVICVFLLLTILLDSFCYFSMSHNEIAKFSKYIYCLYVFSMLYQYIQEYVEKTRGYTEVKMMAKLAYKDVMTGLYNRTAYTKDIAEYEKLICLAPKELNLIYVIFDLNNLKEMNDSHGHGVGDYYIVTTGQIIKKAFEKVGKCYRIGGDEFAVIMKDKTVQNYCDAILLLKKLLKAVNETNEFEFSLAFGVAVYEAGKFASLKELIDKADKNMYDNKNIYKESKLCDVM